MRFFTTFCPFFLLPALLETGNCQSLEFSCQFPKAQPFASGGGVSTPGAGGGGGASLLPIKSAGGGEEGRFCWQDGVGK